MLKKLHILLLTLLAAACFTVVTSESNQRFPFGAMNRSRNEKSALSSVSFGDLGSPQNSLS